MDKQIWMGKLLILSLIFPSIIYLKTLLPSLDFWDTGEFQTIPYTFDIGHPTGYPTYILLGKTFLSIFGFKDISIAWKMNYFSALSVSMGIFIFSTLLKKLTGNVPLSIVSSIFLSLNPYLWSVAIRADPHALHFLFTSIFLLLAFEISKNKKYKLFPLIGFISGFSLGNHMLSIFFVPSVVLLATHVFKSSNKKIAVKLVLFSVITFLIGISIYSLLPLISIFKPPLTISYSLATLDGFKRHVFGEDFHGLMKNWIKGNIKDTLVFYFSLVKIAFPFYSWALILPGMIIMFWKDRLFNVMLLITFFSTLLFGLSYQNAAIERYFITSFAIATIWAVTLTGNLTKIFQRNNKILHFGKVLSMISIMFFLFLSSKNLRDNYKKIDQSKNNRAYPWAINTFENIEKGGVVFSWWSYSTPMWYLQKVEKLRTDILIVNSSQNEWEELAKNYYYDRPVYFIENIQLSDPDFKLVSRGNLYELLTN